MDAAIAKDSFFASYVFLSGLTVVTFIEALRTSNTRVRHIMNLETAVSLVAAVVYSIFITKLNAKEITLEQVTPYRYFDWVVTTPLLLLVLLMFYNFSERDPIYISVYGAIVALDFVMLSAGYLGETGRIDKRLGSAVGFAALAGIFALIYVNFIGNGCHPVGWALFVCFVVIWTAYGLVYWIKDVALKNMLYNGLDVIAKVFFGLFMWVYYSGIFTL